MKRILLTGGSGFLGRKLTGALQAHGFVIATPTHTEMDLLDKEAVAAKLAEVRPHIVVHGAAVYGGIGLCGAEPDRLFEVNALMHENLFWAIEHQPPQRVVGIGSSCAYPGALQGDFKEEDYERGELHPSVAGFAASKRLLLEKLRALGLPYQFPILSNMYGDFDSFDPDRSHVIAALIRRFTEAKISDLDHVLCWGSGKPERECLFVNDAAEGLARLIDNGHEGSINLGTGQGISIAELAQTIAHVVGYKGRIEWDATKPDGAPRKVLDISLLQNTLNWRPQTPLTEGLTLTTAWYQANHGTKAY